jgi:endonuclease/exonuclease/phosphatase (EEP) superfamily protein YafD
VARLAGADRIPGIEAFAAPLLAVTPYVAAATPVPLALALGLRRWWAAAAAGVVALALIVPMAPRALGGGQPDARGPVIRVLSANLYFGEADAGDLLDLVRRTNADVLSVQELATGTASRYQKAGLAKLLPHSVVDEQTGAAGSGLFSRYPLRELPGIPEMRMATPQAELTLAGGRRVRVTAVHPVPPLSSESQASWKRDIGRLPSARSSDDSDLSDAPDPSDPSGPVRILAGDFNATLDHAVLRGLIGRGYADAAERAGAGLVPTWGDGGTRPPITIDHVLVDRRCAVTRFDVHHLAGTDHRAVLAEIRLP